MNSTTSLTTYSRRLTHSNTVSYIDDDAIIDANMGYRLMINAIVTKVRDFFWTWGATNAVIGQSEYTIETFTFPDASTRDVLSIEEVSVQYATDGDFWKLTKKDFSALDGDITSYADWNGEPFYFVRDTSIFIFPSPTVAVTGGVKIYGNYRPLDLTMTTAETQIKTPKLWNHLISFYQCFSYWASNKGVKDVEAQNWLAQFNSGITDMVNSLGVRDQEIIGYETSTNPYR